MSRKYVGLVIERKRREGDWMALFYAFPGAKVFDVLFLTDIVAQLPPVFAEFYDNTENATRKSGHHHTKRDRCLRGYVEITKNQIFGGPDKRKTKSLFKRVLLRS